MPFLQMLPVIRSIHTLMITVDSMLSMLVNNELRHGPMSTAYLDALL